jgi:hypothetical protein
MEVRQIINEIESQENKQRKGVSLAETEIYNDKIYPHVERYLSSFYAKETIKEMPIYASINLAKRIVDQEASLYRSAPLRTFEGISEQQIETVNQVYKDLKMDQNLLKSNRAFKLQGQNHIELVPFKGKLQARVLLNHHLDAIPLEDNPEIAQGYVLSGFDRSQFLERQDATDEKIADKADYKSVLRRYAFWTESENFIVDGQGNLLSQDTVNPLGMLPIVEVSTFKDFTYWLERGTAITDFTIQFNAAMTDIAHIVRMQGFAQAWYRGPIDLLPESIVIGPNHILKLPIDPNNPVDSEFGFANPSPDLNGSLAFPQTLLSSFLTSRGLSPKLVTGTGEGQQYTSGLDRLLAMIERFEASQFDMEVYRNAEEKLFKLILRYLNTYAGTELLNYSWSNVNEDNASLSIQYAQPQAIMSEQEKLDAIARKKELGLMSDRDAIMEYYGIGDDAAEEKLAQIRGELIGTITE